MKKTLVTILVFSLIVALSACGELATIQQNPTKPTTAETQPTQSQPEVRAIAPATQPTAPAQQPETQPPVQETTPETQPAAPETTPETQPTVPETTPETQPAAPETTPETQPATKQTISREQAIQIALQDAGLTQEVVTDREAELDREREGLFWEVSFETREKEYDYEIHAYDGTVAKVETEKEGHRPEATPTQPATKPAETQPVMELTVTKEQAVEIALQAAGLTQETVADLEAELEKERNGLFWEVSFETREKEYSYEINANDGKIVKAEAERND